MKKEVTQEKVKNVDDIYEEVKNSHKRLETKGKRSSAGIRRGT